MSCANITIAAPLGCVLINPVGRGRKALNATLSTCPNSRGSAAVGAVTPLQGQGGWGDRVKGARLNAGC